MPYRKIDNNTKQHPITRMVVIGVLVFVSIISVGTYVMNERKLADQRERNARYREQSRLKDQIKMLEQKRDDLKNRIESLRHENELTSIDARYESNVLAKKIYIDIMRDRKNESLRLESEIMAIDREIRELKRRLPEE